MRKMILDSGLWIKKRDGSFRIFICYPCLLYLFVIMCGVLVSCEKDEIVLPKDGFEDDILNTFVLPMGDIELSSSDIPVVADTMEGKLYFTLPENLSEQTGFRMKLRDGENIHLLWDGKIVINHCVEVEDWHGEHTLAVGSPVQQLWNVVFTSLPLVCISVADGYTINQREDVPAQIRVIDPARRTDDRICVDNTCQVHYRGATSFCYPKKSMLVSLKKENGEDKNMSLWGIRKDDKWILDAMAVDLSRMRNRLCFDLWNEIEEHPYDELVCNGTRGVFVEVLFNGRYHGLYCMSDKVNRKLLGLKKSIPGDVEDGIRGVIYKGITWGNSVYLKPDEDKPVDGLVWNDWELAYPDNNPSSLSWEPLLRLIRELDEIEESGLAGFCQQRFYDNNIVTVPVFLLAINARDNFLKNSYLSIHDIKEDYRFWITPWDLDATFGREWNSVLCDKEATFGEVIHGVHPFTLMYQKNLGGYRTKMAQCWHELRQGVLSEENVLSKIRAYATLFKYSGAWEREYERWNGNSFDLLKDIENEASYMEQWYVRNCMEMDRLFGV